MITIQTDFPLATTSNDHLYPFGTRRDNSTNRRFNQKLYRLFPENKPIRVLDLGCSGGQFIESIIEDGHIGVGVEGSDWSKNLGRGAWGKINTLFTADITKPFQIKEDNEPFKADVVTLWDVLEHIKEVDLPQVFENIKRHLKPTGLFITAIGDNENAINGVHLHQTIKPKLWWEGEIMHYGFVTWDDISYFGNQFVRNDDDGNTFNLVAEHLFAKNRKLPILSWKEKLHDKWHGSQLHKRLWNMLQL